MASKERRNSKASQRPCDVRYPLLDDFLKITQLSNYSKRLKKLKVKEVEDIENTSVRVEMKHVEQERVKRYIDWFNKKLLTSATPKPQPVTLENFCKLAKLFYVEKHFQKFGCVEFDDLACIRTGDISALLKGKVELSRFKRYIDHLKHSSTIINCSGENPLKVGRMKDFLIDAKLKEFKEVFDGLGVVESEDFFVIEKSDVPKMTPVQFDRFVRYREKYKAISPFSSCKRRVSTDQNLTNNTAPNIDHSFISMPTPQTSNIPGQPPIIPGPIQIIPGQPPIIPGSIPIIPGQPPISPGPIPIIPGQPPIIPGQPPNIPGEPPVIPDQPSNIPPRPSPQGAHPVRPPQAGFNPPYPQAAPYPPPLRTQFSVDSIIPPRSNFTPRLNMQHSVDSPGYPPLRTQHSVDSIQLNPSYPPLLRAQHSVDSIHPVPSAPPMLVPRPRHTSAPAGDIGFIAEVQNLEISLESKPWFFGKLSREECERILKTYGQQNMFLIRQSTKGAGLYALSVRDDQNDVLHYVIKLESDKVVFGTQTFANVDQLILHYQKNALTKDKGGTLLLGSFFSKASLG